MQEQLTLGLAAVRIGCGVQVHHLARLANQGLIPFTRAGRIRLVRVDDLPAIRAACERAGYPARRRSPMPRAEVPASGADFAALIAAIRETLAAASLREGYSVADLCARWKVGPDKVLGFIRRGELGAVNVETHTSGRPQYRVTPEEVAKFEARRTSAPLPKPLRRKRKPDVKDYYPD
jgi:hypothetical protein